MTILVSACLLGENCKYSGGNNNHEQVKAFVRGHEVIAVCPEVMGGLSVPRLSAEIVDGVVMNRAGESVDAQFRAGVRRVMDMIADKRIDLALLQPRSPSCGVRQVYDGTFSGRLRTGSGLLAQALRDAGIPVMDADELDAAQQEKRS